MSASPTFGGCLAVHLQQTICLAMDILYLVECNCSFDFDFMWYLGSGMLLYIAYRHVLLMLTVSNSCVILKSRNNIGSFSSVF